MEIWEPKPPATLWATLGLLRIPLPLHQNSNMYTLFTKGIVIRISKLTFVEKTVVSSGLMLNLTLLRVGA